MPPFMTLPPVLQPRRGFTRGLPSYSAGIFPVGQSPAMFRVTSVTASGSTVTLGVVQYAGNIPVVGQLATVVGTVQGGPLVNVVNTALTAVSITPATGVGTLSYASAAPAVGPVNDGGNVVVNVPEVGETAAIQKWQQFVLDPAGGELLTMTWFTPSAPTSMALQLEGAIDDVDAQYVIIGTSQTTTSGTVINTVPNGVRFVRVNQTALVGGPGTIVAKLLQTSPGGTFQ